MTQAKECCEWNEAIEAAAKAIRKSPLGKTLSDDLIARIRSLKRAPSHQANREWKLVPVEPTEEMLDDAEAGSVTMEAVTATVCDRTMTYWRALAKYHWTKMLAAAPSHQAGQEEQVIKAMGRDLVHIAEELDNARDRIETLKEALREIIGAAEHCGDGDAPVVIKARAALADGGG